MSAMPTYAMTYVVYWPEAGVLKVGRAWRFHRVQMMVRSGGHIVVLARGTDWTWEAEALKTLRRWFPKAFDREADAHELLFMGRGWTECFDVDEVHLQLAVDLCFEGFARGNDQGVNEKRATEDQRGGSASTGVSPRTDGSEADGPRAVASHGRTRPAGDGAGADRRGDLSRRGRDGNGHRASDHARRVRVPRAVPRSFRRGVDLTHAAAEGRRPTRLVDLPGTAFSRTFAKLRGCGGSAGAGERASACRAGRAGGPVGDVGGRARASVPAAGTAPAAGRSTYRMPGSPARPIRELRTLRHRAHAARPLGSGGPLRRTGHRVGAGAARGRVVR